MSSEPSRLFYYLLALPDEHGRQRLHSSGFTLYVRIVAVMLGIGMSRVFISDVGAAAQRGLFRAALEASIHILLLSALVLLLWFRSKPVIATPNGLELGSGPARRFIPWAQVVDVRELPWIRFSPSWYPRMFQVDLASGEIFDFVGVRKARQVVIDFVKQSEGY